MRAFSASCRSLDQSIGLVPTMGALHEGHLDLVRASMKSTDMSVCSIFVNPIQFNNLEDLAKYPRDEANDFKVLREIGCHAIFAPQSTELYPSDHQPPKFDFGSMEQTMEGAHRPGHFSGVGVVVSKLFNIVQPDMAFFGQKDLQQLGIIRKLVSDLNFPVEIIGVPTRRETSGLAMSSRNRRFDPLALQTAAKLYQGLCIVVSALENEATIRGAKKVGMEFFKAVNDFNIEYLEVVNSNTLEPMEADWEEVSICAAAVVHGVRIIDNVQVTKKRGI